MGVFLAALAWLTLLVFVTIQLVFNKIVLSIPTAHFLGWGPALVGVLAPIEIVVDVLIALFASLATYFALADRRRQPSGRRIGQ